MYASRLAVVSTMLPSSSLLTSLLPSLLPSQSLLYSEYPADDPYILEQFSAVKDNRVLQALHNPQFKPSNIIDYISATYNGFINRALKDFTVEELREAEEVTNYWMFPTEWTAAIREEAAFKERDFKGPVLSPIAAKNTDSIGSIFPYNDFDEYENPFDMIHMLDRYKYDWEVAPRAAKFGLLDCLKYLYSHGCCWDRDTPMSAAEGGHLECLKYAHENGCPWDELTPASAAYEDNLECLKYAHENGCPWNELTPKYAAWNNSLECLKYAHENGCPWDENTPWAAAAGGSIECLKYAHENGCPWDASICMIAVAHDQLECLKYAHEHGCPWDSNTTKYAKHGSKCLEYALDNGCPNHMQKN